MNILVGLLATVAAAFVLLICALKGAPIFGLAAAPITWALLMQCWWDRA